MQQNQNLENIVLILKFEVNLGDLYVKGYVKGKKTSIT